MESWPALHAGERPARAGSRGLCSGANAGILPAAPARLPPPCARARPLALNDEVHASSPLPVHVLEHSAPAQALLDYARNDRVDHLVRGARGITGVRRPLGSTDG